MAAATMPVVSHGSQGSRLPRHQTPKTQHKPKKHGLLQNLSRWSWEWALLVSIILGAVTLITGLPKMGGEISGGAELAKQIRALATGQPMPARTDGVVVRMFSGRDQASILVEHVPPKLCVSAAWDLAKSGTVVINGTTPTRVSGARLAELCNDEDEAQVIWMPKLGN